jgi:alpha-beta hydrolase superfamily lysophospholipase
MKSHVHISTRPLTTAAMLAALAFTFASPSTAPGRERENGRRATKDAENGVFFPAKLRPEKLKEGASWSFTSEDGTRLEGRKWVAQGKPRAILLALHGTQSHAGWYADLADRLKPHGWAVYAPDRRHSGLNNPGTKRLEKPTPADCKDWRHWMMDLDAAMGAVLQEQSRDVPIYIMGSSWSTALAPAYVDPEPQKVPGLRRWRPRHAHEVDGLILNVPAGLESDKPGAKQHLRTLFFGGPLTILSNIVPPLGKIGEKIDLPADTYSRHPTTRALVGDKNMPVTDKRPDVELGEQDPLVIHRATYSFYLRSSALREAGQGAMTRIGERQEKDPNYMPILTVIAEVDDIVGEDLKKLEKPLPGVVVLPGTYHALQVERPDLLSDAIVKWQRGL